MTERRQVVWSSALQVGGDLWTERGQPVWYLNEMKLERGGLGDTELVTPFIVCWPSQARPSVALSLGGNVSFLAEEPHLLMNVLG